MKINIVQLLGSYSHSFDPFAKTTGEQNDDDLNEGEAEKDN